MFIHFLCSSLFGEMIQFDDFLSDGLVQPPTSIVTYQFAHTNQAFSRRLVHIPVTWMLYGLWIIIYDLLSGS